MRKKSVIFLSVLIGLVVIVKAPTSGTSSRQVSTLDPLLLMREGRPNTLGFLFTESLKQVREFIQGVTSQSVYELSPERIKSLLDLVIHPESNTVPREEDESILLILPHEVTENLTSLEQNVKEEVRKIETLGVIVDFGLTEASLRFANTSKLALQKKIALTEALLDEFNLDRDLSGESLQKLMRSSGEFREKLKSIEGRDERGAIFKEILYLESCSKYQEYLRGQEKVYYELARNTLKKVDVGLPWKRLSTTTSVLSEARSEQNFNLDKAYSQLTRKRAEIPKEEQAKLSAVLKENFILGENSTQGVNYRLLEEAHYRNRRTSEVLTHLNQDPNPPLSVIRQIEKDLHRLTGEWVRTSVKEDPLHRDENSCYKEGEFLSSDGKPGMVLSFDFYRDLLRHMKKKYDSQAPLFSLGLALIKKLKYPYLLENKLLGPSQDPNLVIQVKNVRKRVSGVKRPAPLVLEEIQRTIKESDPRFRELYEFFRDWFPKFEWESTLRKFIREVPGMIKLETGRNYTRVELNSGEFLNFLLYLDSQVFTKIAKILERDQIGLSDLASRVSAIKSNSSSGPEFMGYLEMLEDRLDEETTLRVSNEILRNFDENLNLDHVQGLKRLVVRGLGVLEELKDERNYNSSTPVVDLASGVLSFFRKVPTELVVLTEAPKTPDSEKEPHKYMGLSYVFRDWANFLKVHALETLADRGPTLPHKTSDLTQVKLVEAQWIRTKLLLSNPLKRRYVLQDFRPPVPTRDSYDRFRFKVSMTPDRYWTHSVTGDSKGLRSSVSEVLGEERCKKLSDTPFHCEFLVSQMPHRDRRLQTKQIYENVCDAYLSYLNRFATEATTGLSHLNKLKVVLKMKEHLAKSPTLKMYSNVAEFRSLFIGVNSPSSYDVQERSKEVLIQRSVFKKDSTSVYGDLIRDRVRVQVAYNEPLRKAVVLSAVRGIVIRKIKRMSPQDWAFNRCRRCAEIPEALILEKDYDRFLQEVSELTPLPQGKDLFLRKRKENIWMNLDLLDKVRGVFDRLPLGKNYSQREVLKIKQVLLLNIMNDSSSDASLYVLGKLYSASLGSEKKYGVLIR